MTQYLKRLFLYTTLSLLFLSLYDDITVNSPPPSIKTDQPKHGMIKQDNTDQRSIQIRVTSGDTVLSITEMLNYDLQTHLNMKKVISDFKYLNPKVDPYHLKTGTVYSFPIYRKN